MAARLFLFHGSDSRASAAEVRRWQDLFAKKHGDATKYVIEADEGAAADAVALLASALETQSLFPTPKMILVKRVGAKDQGTRSSAGTAMAEAIERLLPLIDGTVTLAVWEEKLLGDAHPLMKAFSKWAAKDLATVKAYLPPSDRSVPGLAAGIAKEHGKEWSGEATAALLEGYRALEKRQRQTKKLKANQDLAEDERSWWLYQLLETACLLEVGPVVTAETVRTSMGSVEVTVSPFDIADALGSRRYAQARKLVVAYAGQDEADFFGLLAALRWKMGRDGSGLAVQLIAQLELIMKNFSLPADLLLLAVIDRLERKDSQWIIEPRTLWLANLARL